MLPLALSLPFAGSKGPPIPPINRLKRSILASIRPAPVLSYPLSVSLWVLVFLALVTQRRVVL